MGLPTPEGRLKKDQFESTKQRLSKCLTSWVERYMLGGAKEVLSRCAKRSQHMSWECLSFLVTFARS
jgi:hypothetical protein